jgi:hypothetical protein
VLSQLATSTDEIFDFQDLSIITSFLFGRPTGWLPRCLRYVPCCYESDPRAKLKCCRDGAHSARRGGLVRYVPAACLAPALMNYSATNYVQCAEPGTASELQLTPLATPDRREPDIAEEGSPVTQAATKKKPRSERRARDNRTPSRGGEDSGGNREGGRP